MSVFTPSKQHFQEIVLHYYFPKINNTIQTFRILIETSSNHVPLAGTCKYWYRRRKYGNFDVSDKGTRRNSDKIL